MSTVEKFGKILVITMFSLVFMTVGDIPRGPLFDQAQEYRTRLSPFVRFEQRIYKDTESLITHVPERSTLVVLEAQGKLLTSEDFADKVRGWHEHGDAITVALGGPFGFADDFKKRADLLLSLSPMTMPHDLAHIVFLEQLYRANTIVAGKKYHY